MDVISYARVSTDDHDQDPVRQHLVNKQYCVLHNHTILAEITDYCTGDSNPFEREQGKNILKFNPRGIVFFSMDRFSRQHPTKVIQMINQMKDRGIKLISVTEPAFNMEGEFAEIIIFMMTWFNNYFLIKLKRDIKSGMDAAKSKGKHIGRKSSTFNKDLARKLLKKGKSQREVAKLLKVSPTTINRFQRGGRKKAKSLYISSADAKPPGLESAAQN